MPPGKRSNESAPNSASGDGGILAAVFRGWSRANVSRIMLVTAFAIAMGHMEGVVVVYIRRILGLVPTPEHLTPEVAAEVPGWVIAIEQSRETATIIMLICLALLAGRNIWQRLGTFLLAFGIWDITYYVALKAMINWPASLTTMDLLFLIPKHWYAPVWVPILISVGLIAAGLACLRLSQPLE